VRVVSNVISVRRPRLHRALHYAYALHAQNVAYSVQYMKRT